MRSNCCGVPESFVLAAWKSFGRFSTSKRHQKFGDDDSCGIPFEITKLFGIDLFFVTNKPAASP
jgi:hypothetical protein